MLDFLLQSDQSLLFFIHEHLHFPLLDQLMILITSIGDKGLIWIGISILLLARKETGNIGIMALLALLISTILGEGILKHIIKRPRPYADFPWVELLIDPSTIYSFPSGHTASSFSVAYVFHRYLKKFAPLVWTLALLMGFSRLYLFMHYPSDIAGGIILGLASGWAASQAFTQYKEKKYENEKKR